MSKLKNIFGDFWFSYGGTVKSIFKVLVSIGSILVIVGLFMGWFDGTSKEDEKQLQENLKNQYKVISEYEIGQPEKYAAKISILLKDRFISPETFDEMIKYIIEKEKIKVKETKKEKLYALQIDVYSREIIYDQGLKPHGTVYYQHKKGWMESFERRLSGYKNHVIESNYTYSYKYDGIKPYNDKEYKTFLRIMELKEIAYNDIDTGIDMYIEYDLKLSKNQDKFYKKFDELKDFIDRAYGYGEPVNMYEGTGEYLLEYYKEADPKFYKYFNNR